MTFATFPWPVVAAGGIILAGLLYFLQRLRSRRRVVHLPAASLWSRAAEEAPLRVLGTRFRYWLAYLLALAIVLALWLAVAHPARPVARGSDTASLFYLDASAVLTNGEDATRAKRALLADVRAAPGDRREVFLGDAVGTRLLAPGESVSLLARRLDEVAAGARPSDFIGWLGDRSRRIAAGQSAVIRYYGAWPVARRAAAGLPARIALTYGYLAAPVPGNRGIVALGVTPAASGRWGKADVLVALAAAQGSAPAADALQIRQGGRDIDAPVVSLGGGRVVLRDIAADGALLEVALRDGDGFAADDRAAIRLPDRRPIPVALGAGVPPAVRDAVRADDAFAIVDAAGARVIVRRGDDRTAPGLPALVLSPAASGAATFVFAGPGKDAHDDLSQRLDEFGLARIDAPALADRLHRAIGVTVAGAPNRSITVWSDLFDAPSGFDRSATMPLFVSQGLRWLAGEAAWVPYAKAGAPLPDASAASGWAGRTIAGAVPGTATFLDDAGEARAGDRSVVVALTDRATTMLMGDAAPRPAVSSGGGAAFPDPLFMALIGIAILLLAGEWWLLRRGWMP